MNIRITVLANQARKAIADTEQSLSRLNAQTAAGGTSVAGFGRKQDQAFKSMTKWGNQLQWTGRQLQYNWTLPLVAAGAAATHFALDQDRAMTSVRKVYGDATMSQRQMTNETNALEKAFVALSSRYGISIKETGEIAAGWAAAGSSGRALAEQVQTTMKTMILGEMDAADATQALISIQAQYGLTAAELSDTMARLNAIENQTGTTTGDLVTAFRRAAGIARETGVDVQHLGAMIAAITPAAGTAAQAGNSLKTIFQRLFSPTREAERILKLLNISTADSAWQSANAAERLEILAKKWGTVSDSQRSVIATQLVGIEQGNRLVVLLNEMNSEVGFYAKAMKAAATDADYFKIAQQELDRVMNSSSHRWEQAGIILQNSMIKVIQPLLPMIIGLAQEVAKLATSFGNLDPNLQKLIVFGLLALAMLGPLVRYFGSLGTLFGVIGRGVAVTAGGFAGLAGMLGLTSKAATTAAASTAAAAATSAAAAATSSAAAGAVSGGFLSRVAGGIRKGAVSLDKAFSSAMGRQVGVTQAGLQKIKATYNLNLGALKFIAQAQLAGLTATMVAGATSAATGFSGTMNGVLQPTFSATMARINGIVGMGMAQVGVVGSVTTAAAATKIRTTFSAIMGNLAYDMRRYGAMASEKLAEGLRALAPAAVGSAEMTNTGIIGGAMRLGAELPMIWASAVGRVEQVYYGHRLRLLGLMQASDNATLVATATYGRAYGTLYGRLLFPAQVATQRLGEALPGMHTRMWARIQAITARGALVMTEIGMARDANLVTRQAATGGILTRMWAGTQARLAAISTVGQARLTAVSAAGHTRLIALQLIAEGRISAVAAAGSARLVAIKGAMFGKLRGMWLAFTAFLSSPAALMGGFKRMGSVVAVGGRGLLGLFSSIGTGAVAALTSPWGLIIAAIVAFIVIFKSQLRGLWSTTKAYFADGTNGIVTAFNALPDGIRNALLRVVAIVRAAAHKVYELFSYLNPFAHHSPSLVENVTNGMAVINQQFGTLSNIQGPIKNAYAGIKRLKDLTASLRNGEASLQIAEDIEKLGKTAPGAIGAYRSLQSTLVSLTAQEERLSDAVAAQEARTDTLKRAVDASSDALDRQKDILQQLEDVASAYSDRISDLQTEISNLSSTPITGMGAMEDAIFGNEMAQKKLRLEIMRMEDAGQTYEDVKNKVAELNGEMDMLRGARETMREAGAGSDILGFYDDQIKKLDQQKKAMGSTTAPIQHMTDELERLGREAERMDLEKSLKFDPLTRSIDKAANGMKEMPFDAIIGKIGQNQSAIDQLQGKYDAANDAVTRQKAVVDQAQAAHDALNASYDVEQQKLEALKDAYQQVADAIGDVNSALGDMRGSADSALKEAEDKVKKLSPAETAFKNAANGNFADVSGGAEEAMKLGREGGMGDQSASIEDFTKQVEEDLGKGFGKLDMLGPIKEMWAKVVVWWDANVGPWITAIGGFFSTIFKGVDFFKPIKDKFDEVWKKIFGTAFSDVDWDQVGTNIADGIRTALGVLATIGQWLWDLFGEELIGTFQIIWDWLKKLWADWGDIFGQLVDRIGPLFSAVKNFAMVIGAVLAPVIVWLIAVLQVVWSVLNGMLGPILGWIVGVFKNLWQVIIGLIDVFIGLFTLDFGTFFHGLGDILGGLGGLIWDTIVSLGLVIWGALKGLVTGLWDSFMWVGKMIWEGLEAGLNAIGLGFLVDIFGGIIDFVKDLFGIASPSKVFADIGGWLMEGLGAGIKAAWNVVAAVFTFIFNLIKGIFETIGAIVTWLWSNIFQPYFTLIGNIVTWLWNTVIKPVAGFIWGAITSIGDVVSWLWTNAIQPAFGFIGDIFTWLYDSVVKPVIAFIKMEIEGFAAIAKWLWNNVLKPVFGFIGDIFSWLYDKVVKPIIAFIKMEIEGFAAIINWLWDNIIKPVFGLIGDIFSWIWDKIIKPIVGFIVDIIKTWIDIISWLWDRVLSPIFGFIGAAFKVLGDGIAWVWNNVIKPAWGAIQSAAGWLWDNVLKPIFKSIGDGFKVMGEGLDWVWKNVIKPAWDALSGAAKSVADWVSEKFGWLKDTVIDIFTKIRDTVGQVWDGLLDKVKTPIRVVFDFVNGNMIRPINELLGKFPGGLHIGDLPHLATGGPVRGPGTGTSDSILGVDKRGVPTARVSNGEYVVNERSTKANFSLISAINAAKGKLPGFDIGGVVGGAWNGLKGAGSWAKDKASDAAGWVGDKVGDLIAKGGRFAAEQILRPLANTAKGLVPGDGIFPNIMRGTIDKLVDGVLGKGDEHDREQATLANGKFARSGGRTPNGIGGLGPAALAARNFVMSTFGISNIGGYSYRNIAGTSTLSDHATGHAIDVMIPNYKAPESIAKGNRIASYFVTHPEAYGTKYVIWRDQINQGGGWEAYGHPGGGRNDTLQHRDHVHVSLFDQGGVLNSGSLAMNMSGRPERILSAAQTQAFDRLVAILDATGVPSVASIEAAIFRAEARKQQVDTIGSKSVVNNNGDTNVTMNFYGDLSFPNIKDGDDADVFLQNLGDLAGGRR